MHSLWLIWYLCLIFYIISYINCCKHAARQQYVRIRRYNLGYPCLHGSTAVDVIRRQVYLIIYAHSRKLASLNVKNRSASKINMQTDQVCRSILCKQNCLEFNSLVTCHLLVVYLSGDKNSTRLLVITSEI